MKIMGALKFVSKKKKKKKNNPTSKMHYENKIYMP